MAVDLLRNAGIAQRECRFGPAWRTESAQTDSATSRAPGASWSEAARACPLGDGAAIFVTMS